MYNSDPTARRMFIVESVKLIILLNINVCIHNAAFDSIQVEVLSGVPRTILENRGIFSLA